MPTEDWGARAREIYTLELDYTVGRAGGDKIDVLHIEERAAIRLANEIVTDEDKFGLARLAMRLPAKTITRSHMPKFDDGGSVRLRMTDIIRVADNLVVSVVHATDDDWLAYLEIKRVNAERQAHEFESCKAGILRIIADLRAFSGRTGLARPGTFDACGYLFDSGEEQAA